MREERMAFMKNIREERKIIMKCQGQEKILEGEV